MRYAITSILFLVSLLIGCNGKVDDNLEQEIIRTLEENNRMLDETVKKLQIDFREKASKPEYEAKTKIWFLKTQKADSLLKSFLFSLEEKTIKNDSITLLFDIYENNILNIDSLEKNEIESFVKGCSNSQKEYLKSSQNIVFALYKNKTILLRNSYFDYSSKQFCFLPITYE